MKSFTPKTLVTPSMTTTAAAIGWAISASPELKEKIPAVIKECTKQGLDPFPLAIEEYTADEIAEIAAYGGSKNPGHLEKGVDINLWTDFSLDVKSQQSMRPKTPDTLCPPRKTHNAR